MENKIKLFNDKKIRTHWDEEQDKWYFSIVDIVSVLTDSVDAGVYWRKQNHLKFGWLRLGVKEWMK